MNALELANDLEDPYERCEEIVTNQAAAELRRLHAINAELLEILHRALIGLGQFDRKRNKSYWEQHQKSLKELEKAKQ